MKKVILVSFFKSNNLGDLALSLAIENILKDDAYELYKYDFSTITPIRNNLTNTTFEEKKISKSRSRVVLRLIKKTIIKILGPSILENAYYFYQTLFSPKWKNFTKDLKESEILILAGGNMVMDISNSFSIPNWATLFRTYCRIAAKNKKDIYISYIGAGPFNFKQNKLIFGKALNLAKKITVRDPISMKVCEELVENKMKLSQTVDPVFSLSTNMLENRTLQLSNIKSYKIGICVLDEHCFSSKNLFDAYFEGLYDLVNELSLSIPESERVEFILFSTETADYQSVNSLYNRLLLDRKHRLSIGNISKIDEVIELYKNLNFLIGGRMHSLIFSQICLLPFIGFAWQHKVKGFGKVTESSNRIFEVPFKENITFIRDSIIEDITDINLIYKMNKKNIKLNEIAQKGIDIF